MRLVKPLSRRVPREAGVDEAAPPHRIAAQGPSLSRRGEGFLTALHVPRTASDDGVIG